jgi:hypothetical protein
MVPETVFCRVGNVCVRIETNAIVVSVDGKGKVVVVEAIKLGVDHGL